MPRDETSKRNAAQGWGVIGLWTAFSHLLHHQKWLIFGLIAALPLTEIGLRLVRPDLAGLVYSANLTGGNPVAVTSQGFRIPPSKNANMAGPVVIGIGDSTTYGTGVAAEDTWPLAIRSAASLPLNLHNGGFKGASLKEVAHRYDTIWSAQEKPAAVVLMVSANMISFTDFRWDSTPKSIRPHEFQPPKTGAAAQLKQALQSSALWKAVSINVNTLKYAAGLSHHRVDPIRPLSPLMAYGWQQPDLPSDAQDRMWQRFETTLTDLRDAVRADGSCLIVGFIPPRFMLGDRRLDNLKFVPKSRLTQNAETRTQQLALALDIPFAKSGAALRDLRETTSSFITPIYIPDDYTHLSALGHAQVAQGVAQIIEPILSGDAPCAAQ